MSKQRHRSKKKTTVLAPQQTHPEIPRFVENPETKALLPRVKDDDQFRESMQYATGIANFDGAGNLVSRLLMCLPNGNDELVANAAMAYMATMAPRDTFEALLVAQMIAAHEMSLTYARHAVLSGKNSEQVGHCVNRCQKLMRTYATHLDTLMRYRNQGKQTIQVNHQHVTVSDGGQAIVGTAQQVGGR